MSKHEMNKQQLAERLARQSRRSRGEAADRVDRFVYELLKDLPANESKPAKIAGKAPSKAGGAKSVEAPKAGRRKP